MGATKDEQLEVIDKEYREDFIGWVSEGLRQGQFLSEWNEDNREAMLCAERLMSIYDTHVFARD